MWKVGHKVFAIENWARGTLGGITFKVSETSFEHLKNVRGIRPAPYFASRGLKWVQYYVPDSLPESVLARYIEKSYLMVSASLSTTMQRKLKLPSQPPVRGAGYLLGGTRTLRQIKAVNNLPFSPPP